MSDLSWSHGFALWLLIAGVVAWLAGEILHRFGPRDDEWDEVAERKRLTEKRAKKLSGEMQ